MAHRTFIDAFGKEWEAWDVHPGTITVLGRRLTLRPGMEAGWLAFKSTEGNQKRLAPIPEDWEGFSDHQLDVCRELAEPIRPRR